MDQLGFALHNVWLIPALPLISFVLVALFLRHWTPKLAGPFATLAVFGSAAIAYMVAYEYFTLFPPGKEHPAIIPWALEWLRYQAGMTVYIGALIDPISVMLLIVVTTVSSLVHLYSLGYMHDDEGIGRFFAYLNLFTFSMLGLVLSPNIVQMYAFWELVGVSSFLLIGFYYTKPSAVAASKKAFIVTRFADLGFMVGVLLLGYVGYNSFEGLKELVTPTLSALRASELQPFDFLFLTNAAVTTQLHLKAGFFGFSFLTIAMLLVYMGAAGKSAMFPLHIWLPDAMEGPTPVSALIHAATMVVAGVYLTARLFPAFACSGDALLFVAYIGAFTSLFAALIGITQDDIKRVLAFSTLSQLGYMMMALGVATMANSLGYTASMFHLFTHAFFKALLFLGAGAVIHAVHTNDVWEMGGLRSKMPVTHATFLIATLAISGVPGLSGFFSKDEILAAALHNHHPILFGVALLVAGLTAFYMFRIYFLTFGGACRTHNAEHAHEAPLVMLIPLMILAVLSIFSGYLPMADFISIGQPLEHHGIDPAVAIPATVIALIGIFAAWFLYGRSHEKVTELAKTLGAIHTTVKKKFYIDEIYLLVTHSIIFCFIARPIAWFDRHVVDGAVDLTGWLTATSGSILSRTQTGQVQTYALFLTGGVLVAMLILFAAPL